MPTLSQFYGIRIFMNFGDHLPPHFHAEYGDEEALIEIRTGAVNRGSLSPRALRLVQEWLDLHRAELEENWVLAQREGPLFRIAPL